MYKNIGKILLICMMSANAWATDSLPNGCNDGVLFPANNTSYITAIWQLNSYDCAPGYYLPADGIECELCPQNNYCSGGIYDYSETVSQGIMSCPNEFVSAPGMYEVGSCGRKFHIGNEVVYLRSTKKPHHR